MFEVFPGGMKMEKVLQCLGRGVAISATLCAQSTQHFVETDWTRQVLISDEVVLYGMGSSVWLARLSIRYNPLDFIMLG